MYLLFILSGVAGLIYQVIWVRVLQYSFGNTDLAVSTVIAVYMGGLALGAWLAGRHAWRFRRPILVYGLLELAVAIYAVGVTPFLYRMDFLYGLVGANAGITTLTVLRFVAATVLLFVPTVCMGATLPVLTKPLVSMERTGEGVGLLYFVNTLGAVLGSALAGFALIRFLGLQSSLYVGACIGVTVMLGAFLLQRGLPQSEVERPPKKVRLEPDEEARQASFVMGLDVVSPRAGFTLILIAAAMCGYISLVNEVVWTRMLGFLLDGTVYGFSALLASFLMGIALGSLFISPFIDASRDLWGLFAKIQFMAALGCIFTILTIPLVPALVDAFIGTGTGVEGGFALKVAIVFFIILVPTLFFGAAFPVCVTIAARYRGLVASSMGTVYASNTVGSILGSISGGILLLALVRDLNTILVSMVFLSLLLALSAGTLSTWNHVRRIGAKQRGARTMAWQKGLGLVAGPLVVMMLVGVLKPNVQIYRLVCARYAVEDYDRSLGFKVAKSEAAVDRIVWKAQGRVTVVTVHRLADGGLRLRNNGLNEAYHGTSEPRYAQVIWYLGVLPYLLHPKPERALQIGLGGGGTAECLTKTDLKEITVVELEPEVVNASRWIYRKLLGPGKHPSDDKRVKILTDDGRNALLRFSRSRPHHFDMIVSQPSHAWLSGVASLYTEEHFAIVRKNLRKGGIFCQWINLFRMDQVGLEALLKAFAEAFPRVAIFQVDSNSLLLVGGDDQLKLDPAVVRRHLKEPVLHKEAELFSIDEYAVFRHYLFGRKTALALAGDQRANSDKYPIIEMRLPWVLHNDTVNIKRLLRRRKLPWGITPALFHRGEGFKKFLRGMTEDLITEFDTEKFPLKRAQAFVDEAAPMLGAEGWMLKGRLARLAGDVVTAGKAYRKAAAGGLPSALFQLGSLDLTLERFEEAAKLCGTAYEKTQRADAHLCVAEARYRQGRFPEAAALLEAMFVRKEEDEAPGAHKWLGMLHYRHGRFKEARRELEAFVKVDAADDEAPYYLGLLAAARGDHYQARQYFATAVANARSLAENASATGKRYAKRGHELSAVAQFRQAVRRQRDLGEAYKWMAAALRRWARFGEMKRTLDTLEKQDPTDGSTFRATFRNTANLSERLGEALTAYRADLAAP